MNPMSYDAEAEGDTTLVVFGYPSPIPGDQLSDQPMALQGDRERVEIGRLESFFDIHQAVWYRVTEPQAAVARFQFRDDALKFVYWFAFPHRKVLAVNEGNLSSAQRALAAAGVPIIAYGAWHEEHEAGWIEVDDPRDSDVLLRLMAQAEAA